MTRVHRRLAAATVALLLAPGLSGCGGDPDYCATLKEKQAVFVDDGTGLGLVNGIGTLEELAADAPEDLQDEWQVFVTAVVGLRDAITSLGLDPSAFVDGQPPDGTSAADRQAVAAAAQRLAQADVTEAATGIEQHGKDICKLQLGL